MISKKLLRLEDVKLLFSFATYPAIPELIAL